MGYKSTCVSSEVPSSSLLLSLFAPTLSSRPGSLHRGSMYPDSLVGLRDSYFGTWLRRRRSALAWLRWFPRSSCSWGAPRWMEGPRGESGGSLTFPVSLPVFRFLVVPLLCRVLVRLRATERQSFVVGLVLRKTLWHSTLSRLEVGNSRVWIRFLHFTECWHSRW